VLVLRKSRRAPEQDAALADFYAPGLTANSFVDRAFSLISRLVPGALNSHGIIDAETGVLSANFDCAPPGLADAFEAFGRHMAKYAPFRFDPAVNGGKPFSARDFYSGPAFRDLDIYQEVYRPMRLVDHCFVHVPAGPGATVFVGLLRDSRPFTPMEKELLTPARSYRRTCSPARASRPARATCSTGSRRASRTTRSRRSSGCAQTR